MWIKYQPDSQVGVSALAGLAVLSILVPANLVGEAVRHSLIVLIIFDRLQFHLC